MKGRNKIRLAIISRAVFPHHGFGGLERHLYYQIKHLASHNVEVHVITKPPLKGLKSTDTGNVDNIHYIYADRRPFPVPIKKGFIILDRILNYPFLCREFAEKMLSLNSQKKLDAVISHGLTGWGIAKAINKKRLNLLHIFNPHGMEEFKNLSLIKTILYYPFRKKIKLAARDADLVVATDRIMIPEVEKLLKIERDKITLLPNAVDVKETTASENRESPEKIRKRFKLSSGERLVFSVGRLEENKGFANLLEQIARINTKMKDNWQFIIAGDGSQKKNLLRIIDEKGLSGKVTLTGRISDNELHGLYHLAEIFILPSLYEGSSIATLEAMAHSCAVVANSIGGLPDKIDEGVNGILCDRANPDELGDALLTLTSKSVKELRTKGRESFRKVSTAFSWETVAKDTVELIKSRIK